MEEATSATINEKTWRWFDQTASVRMSPQADIVAMFHFYHGDDFAARLIKKYGFKLIRFPAIADGKPGDPTGREVGEMLQHKDRTIEWLREREQGDPVSFYSMFQGTPLPAGSGLFLIEYFREETMYASPPACSRWVRYFDLAVSVKESADWTAGALVGHATSGGIVCADVRRWRKEWPQSRAEIIRIALEDKARIPAGETYTLGVEAFGQQLALVNDLQTDSRLLDAGIAVWPVKQPGDKKQKASLWASKAAGGGFGLVRAEWNGPFISECLAFSGIQTDVDDQIDAVSGGVHLLYRDRPDEVATRIVNPDSFEAFKERMGIQDDD